MSASYEFHLHDSLGRRLAILPTYISAEMVRSVNTVGTLTLRLPYGMIRSSWLQQDYILVPWRSINGGTRTVHTETVYLIQKIKHADRDGQITTMLECVDSNELLRRRCIAYYAGTAQAAKSAAPADNIMKAFVRENLASTASDYAGSTSRGLSASGFLVQADLGLGATTSKAAAWRNLYDVLRDLADDSRQRGTWLAFDMAVRPGLGQEFRTYAGQRGIDRRSGSSAVLVSQAAGTLINTELLLDYSQAATTVYAGGKGEQSARLIQSASDTTRIKSPAGRIEHFTTAYQGETAAYVLSEAQADLASRRPRVTLSGQIQESHALQYGRNLNFGDYVQVEGFGMTLDARLDTLITTLGDDGSEQIVALLRSETLL